MTYAIEQTPMRRYHGLGNRQRGMLSGFALALANRAAFWLTIIAISVGSATLVTVDCALLGRRRLLRGGRWTSRGLDCASRSFAASARAARSARRSSAK